MIDDVMRARRSVRRFTAEVPDRALIERALAAATSAPSASNKQPWRFLVVTNRERVARAGAAVREAVERVSRHVPPALQPAFRAYGDYFTRFESAPVVIVALFRTLTVLSNLVDARLAEDDVARIAIMERDSGLIGTALALQNLMLMAHTLGLGTSGMTGPLLAADALREIFEITPSWEIAALVPLGFPAEVPPSTTRKPVSRVVEWLE